MQVEKIKCIICYLYTIVCITSPILRMYSWGKIELPIWIMLFISPIMVWLLISEKNIKIFKQIIIILILYLVEVAYITVFDKNILGLLHMMPYICMMLIFNERFLNRNLGIRIYKLICIGASIYGIIQLVVAELFNYYISGSLPWGNSPAYRYAIEMNLGMINKMDVRPRSFFAEPSDFGMYVGIFLIISLWTIEEHKLREVVELVLISIGLICVRSSTGILLLGAAWFIFCIRKVIRRNLKKYEITILLLMLCMAIAFMFTDTAEIFFSRTFDFNIKGGTMGRIGGFAKALNVQNYTVIELILGHGCIPVKDSFLPGWMVVLWYFGVFGVVVYIIFLVLLWNYANDKRQKYLVIIILINSFFLTVFFTQYELFYYSLYKIYEEDKSERKKVEKGKFKESC